MWKLWHKLFGWQYVLLRSNILDFRYIRKVYKIGDEKYIVFCGDELWFLKENGKVDNGYSWKLLTK